MATRQDVIGQLVFELGKRDVVSNDLRQKLREAEAKLKKLEDERANQTLSSELLEQKDAIISFQDEKILDLENRIKELQETTTTVAPATPPQTPIEPEATPRARKRGQTTTGSSTKGIAKRKKFHPSSSQTKPVITNIVFRSQGPMLIVKWSEEDNTSQEIHAEDMVEEFKQEVGDFLKGLKEKKSRKIETITKKNLPYLIELM